MGERVFDASYWIDANGVVDAGAVDLLQAALVSPGDWGSFSVRREGAGKVVIGPVSILVLPDAAAEMEFALQLEKRADDEDDIGRPEGMGRQPR